MKHHCPCMLALISAVVLTLGKTQAFSPLSTRCGAQNRRHSSDGAATDAAAIFGPFVDHRDASGMRDDNDGVEKSIDSRRSAISSLAVALTFSILNFAHLPSAQAADITKGSELFAGNCAGCHAGGMNFVKEAKTLKSEALIKNVGSTDGDDLKKWVMESGQHKRNVYMRAPSGNGKLTESEFADVTAFISDQAVGDKW